MAGPHRDAIRVQQRRDVMRVQPVDRERHDGAARGPDRRPEDLNASNDD